MPVVTRYQIKVKEENFEKFLSEIDRERKNKLNVELSKKNIKIFVVGGSDSEGLNSPTMRIFKNIIKAKEYEEKIKSRNDFTEMSIVTNSGEFIYLLKEEILDLLNKSKK
jgi:hypothetical protein